MLEQIELGKITVVNLLTSLISIVAICISIYTIRKNNSNQKRQIKISKLEEIIEIQYFLAGNYNKLFRCFRRLVEYENGNFSEFPTEIELKRYENSLNRLKQNISVQDLFNKIQRLRMLTKCYVANESIKYNIISYTDILLNLIPIIFDIADYEDRIVDDMPKTNTFKDSIVKIENGIIKEMNLDNKPIDKSRLEKYRNKIAKELDVQIINH